MLVLPGGKPYSTQPSHPWHAANLRMAFLSQSLRRRLGPTVQVQRMRYRMRGWNEGGRDAVVDAASALAALRRQFDPTQIVLVGHSMGARVAAHLSTNHDAGAVVALAPWWPRNDSDQIPVGCRLRVLHGTADTWTDADASRAQTERARLRGGDAQWLALQGAGHYLIRHWHPWHELTADFVAEQLCSAQPER